MSAVQTNALNAALGAALDGIQRAGGLRVVALADERGLAWAAVGDVRFPDEFAAIPSLIERAFQDRQPLLRFFSEKSMRFEYHSDLLAHIRKHLEDDTVEPSFAVDVPGDKEAKDSKDARAASEFVIGWGAEYLLVRRIKTLEASWSVLGITNNPAAARQAMQKGLPALMSALDAAGTGFEPGPVSFGETALHGRISAVLDAFEKSVPGIQMAAVTSKDGFVVAALEGGTLEPEMVAPLMGHSFLAIQESTQQICGSTESVMLRMDEGILLAGELTTDLLFAALLAPTACTGIVMSAFDTAAATLRSALEAMATSITVPQQLEVAA